MFYILLSAKKNTSRINEKWLHFVVSDNLWIYIICPIVLRNKSCILANDTVVTLSSFICSYIALSEESFCQHHNERILEQLQRRRERHAIRFRFWFQRKYTWRRTWTVCRALHPVHDSLSRRFHLQRRVRIGTAPHHTSHGPSHTAVESSGVRCPRVDSTMDVLQFAVPLPELPHTNAGALSLRGCRTRGARCPHAMHESVQSVDARD